MKILLSSLFLLLSICASGQDALLPLDHMTMFDSPGSTELSQYIEGVAADHRIIGLGEVSHYTQECYLLKEQIIMTLIDQGYDGLILEVDAGQAMIWDDYVTKGIGNLDTIVASSGWFTFRTQEFKQLLANIRSHNQTADAPFHLYGMEMTAVNHNLDRLLSYFSIIHDENSDLIRLLNQERQTIAFPPYKPEERLDYWNLYHLLEEELSTREATYRRALSPEDYASATHLVEMLRQFATYVSQDDFSLKAEFRDQFSARNVWWCMNQLGEDSQVIIWAHNGHIAHTSVVSNYDVLGHYLQQWFGDEYFALGFTFHHGEFGAFSAEGFKRWSLNPSDTTSLTTEFSKLAAPYVLLKVREALGADPSPSHPLRQSQLIRTDISEFLREGWGKWMPITVADCYDAMIHIEETHYPTTITWLE